MRPDGLREGEIDRDGGEAGEGDCEGVRSEGEDQRRERTPVRARSPQTPSKEEVEQHGLAHLTYRDWCEHCVRGRGREWPHRRVKEEAAMPELHADLCFLGDETETDKALPVFVVERVVGGGVAVEVDNFFHRPTGGCIHEGDRRGPQRQCSRRTRNRRSWRS